MIRSFLSRHDLFPGDISFLLAGYNGDPEFDPVYDQVRDLLFPGTPTGWFKHLSGEYYTSAAFGTWVAAKMLKRQEVPSIVRHSLTPPPQLRHVLIYNQYRLRNQSLILLSAE